jgi:hypothetical protein
MTNEKDPFDGYKELIKELELVDLKPILESIVSLNLKDPKDLLIIALFQKMEDLSYTLVKMSDLVNYLAVTQSGLLEVLEKNQAFSLEDLTEACQRISMDYLVSKHGFDRAQEMIKETRESIDKEKEDDDGS